MAKTFLVLTLVLLLGTAVFVTVAGLQSTPLVGPPKRLSHQDLARIKQLLSQHNPRQMRKQEVRTLLLTQRDLNLLLTYAAPMSPSTNIRTNLRRDGMTLELTVQVPHTVLGDYLNITANFVANDKQVRIKQLSIGELQLPGWILQPMFMQLHRLMLTRYPEYRTLAEAIIGYRFQVDRLIVRYQSDSNLVTRLQQSGKAFVFPERDSRRILIYHQELARLAEKYSSRRLSLEKVLVPLFRLAATRAAEHGEARAENRALIFTLAIHSLGMDIGHFIHLPATPRRISLHLSLLGRYDLAQHYLLSAALAISAGGNFANAIGVFKELDDSRGGSGFSFADLLADRAGIRLAGMATETEQQARVLQQRMASAHSETDFMPDIDDLPEGIMELEFKRRYNDLDSENYKIIEKEIEERLSRCRIYRP
jgi:hypothetical protein